MTTTSSDIDLPSCTERALHVRRVLKEAGITSQVGTPCGILAPLWRRTHGDDDVPLVTISREDTALGYAAGQALAGGYPAVLMQNSGFGNCVNVMASLVCPYEIPIILIISLRGTGNDTTPENASMGSVTASILAMWGVVTNMLVAPEDRLVARDLIKSGPVAILIGPEYLGWCP
ncbi:thiamine pyrophosphate-binding protein [Paucibacter sp. B2R-40]|uniref:thiamine pyrophosphate-binding protein n=1 Tax=Paucibacter sp. B2R-40 TaxID=2893554 RepID=UPI00398D3264